MRSKLKFWIASNFVYLDIFHNLLESCYDEIFSLELKSRVHIWTIVREMKTTCVDSLWFLHYFWLLFRCDKASVFKNFIISIRWRRQKKTPLPWISIHHFSRQNTYMSIIFSNSTSIQWIHFVLIVKINTKIFMLKQYYRSNGVVFVTLIFDSWIFFYTATVSRSFS